MNEVWKRETERYNEKTSKLEKKYKISNTKYDTKEDIVADLTDEDRELLDGLLLTDKEVDQCVREEWPEDPKVPIYGVLKDPLTKCEKKLLMKPPKHPVYVKLDKKEFEKEIEALKTKIRYSRLEEPGEMDLEKEE